MSEHDEQQTLKSIIVWLNEAFDGRFDDCLPADYFCFDLESSGFKKDTDLILSLGHCRVENNDASHYESVVLDWTVESEFVEPEWLAVRINHCQRQMGDSFHGIDMERITRDGTSPRDALGKYCDLFAQAYDEETIVVGHNLYFDISFMEAACEEWLLRRVPWNELLAIDTAAIEKAVIVGISPKPNEAPGAYFRRVRAKRAKGVRFQLSTTCVEKYDLVNKYGLNMSHAHKDPGFDAMLCHLLLQEYRIIAGC